MQIYRYVCVHVGSNSGSGQLPHLLPAAHGTGQRGKRANIDRCRYRHIYMYVCMYVCMYIYIYIHIYI